MTNTQRLNAVIDAINQEREQLHSKLAELDELAAHAKRVFGMPIHTVEFDVPAPSDTAPVEATAKLGAAEWVDAAEQVLAAIRERQSSAMGDICRATGLSRKKAHRIAQHLVSTGEVKRTGTGAGTRYTAAALKPVLVNRPARATPGTPADAAYPTPILKPLRRANVTSHLAPSRNWCQCTSPVPGHDADGDAECQRCARLISPADAVEPATASKEADSAQ